MPLKDQLQRLLNLPEVWHFFRNPSMSNDGIQRDINDCKYVKSHRFQEDPTNFLKIALYYDDVEIQNPLRSSQKYKLSMFYFQLLNIPVQFRSKLSSISLLAVCRSKNLQKFGVKNILQDFIETINVLGTSGLNLQINGSEFNVKGALLYAICDTPAAALLGGFKESSLAKRPCRKCYAELGEMREKFHSQDFTPRNMESHLKECSVIENPKISKANRAFWSKFYGINCLPKLKISP